MSFWIQIILLLYIKITKRLSRQWQYQTHVSIRYFCLDNPLYFTNYRAQTLNNMKSQLWPETRKSKPVQAGLLQNMLFYPLRQCKYYVRVHMYTFISPRFEHCECYSLHKKPLVLPIPCPKVGFPLVRESLSKVSKCWQHHYWRDIP